MGPDGWEEGKKESDPPPPPSFPISAFSGLISEIEARIPPNRLFLLASGRILPAT